MIIEGQLPWSSEDEAKWNNFLLSETGRRLIPKIAESAPVLLDGADVNKTLVRNGELRGFQESLRAMFALSHSVPLASADTRTEYPALDDDKAWGDGAKLTPEEKPKD
jgi:hypothetical protein